MSSESSIDLDAVPAALCERDQWVGWRVEVRDGKETKVPVNPETGGFGSATDSVTWADVETAFGAVADGRADGVGFVFTDDGPLVGVDLDDCRDPETGDVDDAAQDIIERLDSYTEVSPSGTGFHVLVAGDLPAGRNRRGNVECYDTARFFTVTGDHVSSTPEQIVRRQDALEGIHREYVQPDEEVGGAEDSGSVTSAVDATASSEVGLADAELLERAMGASNGEKFERLWNGRTVGYESQSEADMALCCLLAFWTGGDQARIDQLFRESGLFREKWDEVHYADGSTYGEKTVERAVAQTTEFYEPGGSEKYTQDSGASEDGGGNAEGGDGERSRAYLREKNQLLADRVDELEATLKEKNRRIEALEAEVERLMTALQDRGRDDARARKGSGETEGSEDDAGTSSVWSRTKRFLGDRSG